MDDAIRLGDTGFLPAATGILGSDDQAEKAARTALNHLQTALGWDLTQATAFLNSDIGRLYASELRRNPDPEGLRSWDELEEAAASFAALPRSQIEELARPKGKRTR